VKGRGPSILDQLRWTFSSYGERRRECRVRFTDRNMASCPQLRRTPQPKRDSEQGKARTMRIAACLLAALFVAACSGGGPHPSAMAKISVSESSIIQMAVGQKEQIRFTVKNTGTLAIGNMIVVDLMGEFKKHNVVTAFTCDPMGCQENTSMAGFGDVLTIGKVAAGETVTIDITAVAKEAGNYIYRVQFLDLGASDPNLINSDNGKVDSYLVEQTVTP
jgi:hypothetical protein